MPTSSKALQSMDDSGDSKPASSSVGPPAANPKPKPAQKSSLFSSAGKELNSESQSGMGAEGSSPQMIAMQGMALTQRGVQMLALASPGIMPVLSDLMGRLQTIIPQLVSDMSNGGTGMFPPGGMPPAQPPAPAPPAMPGGAPPMAGPPTQ